MHAVSPGFAAPFHSWLGKVSSFTPLATVIALIVAVGAAGPPSSGLFQSEPSQEEKNQQS